MKKNILSSVAALAMVSTLSQAGGVFIAPPAEVLTPEPVVMNSPSPIYIGLGALWGRYNGSCGSASSDCEYEDATYGALGRLGVDINQYFGLEARILGSFLDVDENGGEELQHVGLFVKPMLPLGEDISVYGLIGYGWTQTKAGKYLTEIDDDGLSIGVGFEIDFSDMEEDRESDVDYRGTFDGQGDQEKGFGLFVDYQRLLIKKDVPEMDVVSAGITYDF